MDYLDHLFAMENSYYCLQVYLTFVDIHNFLVCDPINGCLLLLLDIGHPSKLWSKQRLRHNMTTVESAFARMGYHVHVF